MNKSKLSILLGSMMAIGIFTSLAGTAFASSTNGMMNRRNHGNFQRQQSVSGTATAVSGSTITVLSGNGTMYTVNASGAKVSKLATPPSGGRPVKTAIAVADIQTGDPLKVLGTVSGTTVTATQITDGWLGGMMGGQRDGSNGQKPEDNRTGNGKESQKQGVGGTVSAISGSSITLLGKDGTTYTIDATHAKINKFVTLATGGLPVRTDIPVADIAVGDTLRVQGTVSGSTVTATQITDGLLGERVGKGGDEQETANNTDDENAEAPNNRQSVSGTATAISGSTITLQGGNSTVYTVDATNAMISKLAMPANGGRPVKTPIAVADIKTGDTLRVQGTFSGTQVTATQITDGLMAGNRPGSGGYGHYGNGY